MFLKKLPTGTDTYHRQQETLLVFRLHSVQEVPPCVLKQSAPIATPKNSAASRHRVPRLLCE